jgi:hypothetical protein
MVHESLIREVLIIKIIHFLSIQIFRTMVNIS